ncbi:MAG TPA: glycosyltransferase family 39 protein [Burkholderiales bacterium]|nr:glycosyltransferase family 39 protein [Burkholderiales bacterium]
MEAKRLRALKRAFTYLVALIVGAIWIGAPSDALIEKDAEQNLAMAYNFTHYGVMSLDTDRAPENLRPSRYREPLPVLLLSGYLLALDPVLDGDSFDELLRGTNARWLKYSNILWGALLVATIFLTARTLRLPPWFAALALLLAHIPLAEHYGTLYSEIAGAALIALASYVALLAVRDRRLTLFFLAGLSFGALMLTKASYFYVAIVLVLLYLGYALYGRDTAKRGFAWQSTALLILGIAVVVAPWMIRNQMQFGSPSIADRGGLVLITRAVKNEMTAEEYVGTFYAYAPRWLQWPIGALTGFKSEDVRAGGRLERLKRGANSADELAGEEGRVDDAISYYWRAKAMRAPKLAAHEAAGHPNPLAAADAELKQDAIEMIKANPGDHLKLTLPFIWRGAPFMLPFLLVILVYAWRRRDAPLAAYVVPSLGLIGFYAALSHFIPRYAEPNAPVVAICAVLLLHRWLEARATGSQAHL